MFSYNLFFNKCEGERESDEIKFVGLLDYKCSNLCELNWLCNNRAVKSCRNG